MGRLGREGRLRRRLGRGAGAAAALAALLLSPALALPSAAGGAAEGAEPGAAREASVEASTARPEGCPRFREASEGLPTAGEWRSYPAFGDVNGDGHLDLAAHPRKMGGPRVFLGDGKGSWTDSSRGLVFPEFTCGVGVELADVDGDGRLDLGVADHCQGPFVFLNRGEEGWKVGPMVDPVDQQGVEDLAFGDLNGDGHVDLLGVGSFGGGLMAYEGDGSGQWERRRDLGLPSVGAGRGVTLGDVNGDGRPDVAATLYGHRRSPSSEAAPGPVWLSEGAESYGSGSKGLPEPEAFQQAAFGDVNGDGELDLALTSRFEPGRRPVDVFLGNGDGGWTRAAEGLPPPMRKPDYRVYHGVAFGDLSGDGVTDLVAVDFRRAAVELWLGDGAGRWTHCPDIGPDAPREEVLGYGLALGDANGDGLTDLAAAFGRGRRGSLEVWLQVREEAGTGPE